MKKNFISEKTPTAEHKNKLVGHAFFKIDFNERKDTILYKYCFADFRTYRIYNERIFLNYGQESYFMNIKEVSKENNGLKYKVKFVWHSGDEENKEEIFVFKRLDKKNKYWQINDEIYIDSLFSAEIPLVKELDPCPEWEDY